VHVSLRGVACAGEGNLGTQRSGQGPAGVDLDLECRDPRLAGPQFLLGDLGGKFLLVGCEDRVMLACIDAAAAGEERSGVCDLVVVPGVDRGQVEPFGIGGLPVQFQG
jgi:hypothetical protein